MIEMLPAALLVLASVANGCVTNRQPPNVMFVVADDLGWNDVGWNNPDIISPNLDKLAETGIILDYNYVQPVCSPSRAAFFTGTYPYKMGLQHLVIQADQSVCLPLDKKMLPQVMKDNGYATHMLGKWHLGFCKWECTPTKRGFDTFFGFYNGGESYYTKDIEGGFDFRNNEEVYKAGAGNYSAYQYADRMETLIENHDKQKPMFMYLAFQNVHSPLDEVPHVYQAKYPNIKDENRMYVSAMVTAMDDVVGRLVEALKKKGMADNTLIIFTSDNGGLPLEGGSNYPFRGGKSTVFEGGTRVPGFVHGPMLNREKGHFTGLMHAVDWFKTITMAAGIDYDDPDQDGIDQWAAINFRETAQRKEIIYNLDLHPLPVTGRAAIRVGRFKLIDGYPGVLQRMYRPDNRSNPVDLWSAGNFPRGFRLPYQRYLFNLEDDPSEENNLYDSCQHTMIRDKLSKRLQEVQEGYKRPMYPPGVERSNPRYYDMNWSPGWC